MKTGLNLQKQNPIELLRNVAMFISIAATLTQFARFLFISLSRIAFPFTLEWMEGGAFVQVSRILAGQPLYVRPSFDFIPQIYPPVYFYTSALVSKIFGNSFLPLRLVSFIATVGTLFLIYSLVHKQSGSKLGGILASGLYCATFELSGYWFDIARVDSLALALLLLSVYFLLKDNPIASILGGIFLSLSCFTKQTMLAMAGIFLIFSVLPPRKNTLLFIGTASFGFIGGTLLLDWLYEGWFSYYVFHLPARHRVIPNILSLFPSINEILFIEILKPVLFSTAIGLLYLMVYPDKMNFHKSDCQNGRSGNRKLWSGRAVWLILLVAGALAIISFWFLTSLPSDTERGIVGSYSFARLLLIAGPVIMGVLIIVLALKMRTNTAWAVKITNWLFGDGRTVPRILLGFAILVISLIILLSYILPDFFNGVSIAYLQRLSPYLIGPIVLLVAIGLSWRLLWPSDRIEAWFFLLLGLGLIATSWLGRLNPGGYYNVFMPAYAGISILFGAGIGIILEQARNMTPTRRDTLILLVLLLSSAQLFNLLSSPIPQIPTQVDKDAGIKLIKQIEACPGNVYIPYHTYLAELAGKDGYAGVVEMGELKGSFGGKADPLWDEVLYQIQLSLERQTFAIVIQDNQVFRDAMSTNYIETDTVFENDLVFWPVTGRNIRPETVYKPINIDNCLLGGE